VDGIWPREPIVITLLPTTVDTRTFTDMFPYMSGVADNWVTLPEPDIKHEPVPPIIFRVTVVVS
jgi:hypothetical protein